MLCSPGFPNTFITEPNGESAFLGQSSKVTKTTSPCSASPILFFGMKISVYILALAVVTKAKFFCTSITPTNSDFLRSKISKTSASGLRELLLL